MVSTVIVSAGVISAYFFGQAFPSHSLNGLDPIKGQPLPLPYYVLVFGCGLVFWLLVLLWPKLHYSGGVVSLNTADKDARQKDIGEVAKLITVITTINLCGCLALPVRKLHLLFRFLVLFQLSSNLALLLIWTAYSARTIITYISQAKMWFDRIYFKLLFGLLDKLLSLCSKRTSGVEGSGKGIAFKVEKANLYTNRGDDYSGKAAASGSEHAKYDRVCSSPSFPTMTDKSICEAARGETTPTATLCADGGAGYGGKDGASESEHGGDGDGGASGSKHGSEAGGKEESGGGGKEESEGVYGGDDGGGGEGEGQGDLEHGVRKMNRKPTLKISKISEMSIILTAQTTATLIGFHLTTPSFSTKVLLGVVLVVQLVAYLCGLTSMLLELQNSRMLLALQNSRAARDFAHIFARIALACTALGYILMVAMFVHWYIVLITVLLFGVIWIIFLSDSYPLIIKARFWLVNNRLERP